MRPEYYNWENARLEEEILLVGRLTDGYIKKMSYDQIISSIEQNEYFISGNPEKPNRLEFWVKAKEVYNGLLDGN